MLFGLRWRIILPKKIRIIGELYCVVLIINSLKKMGMEELDWALMVIHI